MIAFRMVPFSVGDAGRTERAFGLLVSDNYFSALGLTPDQLHSLKRVPRDDILEERADADRAECNLGARRGGGFVEVVCSESVQSLA